MHSAQHNRGHLCHNTQCSSRTDYKGITVHATYNIHLRNLVGLVDRLYIATSRMNNKGISKQNVQHRLKYNAGHLTQRYVFVLTSCYIYAVYKDLRVKTLVFQSILCVPLRNVLVVYD